MQFKFQLDRTAGFAVKCPWVPKHFLIGRFCYAETGFGFSSSSCNSSTKGRLEFRIIFIPWANCSSGERLLHSLMTCLKKIRMFLDWIRTVFGDILSCIPKQELAICSEYFEYSYTLSKICLWYVRINVTWSFCLPQTMFVATTISCQ